MNNDIKVHHTIEEVHVCMGVVASVVLSIKVVTILDSSCAYLTLYVELYIVSSI